MDPLWIIVAFAFGFAARLVGLPPLVGFLVAGFVLNPMGAQGGDLLDRLKDTGVTLLLFTIGLKLRISSLLRSEVWAGATLHMILTVLGFGALLAGLAAAGIGIFAGLDLARCALLAFALSFSSTVFAVKILEEKGDSGSLYGRTAIGILIMQDLFAVVFLAFTAGKVPTPWALLLLGLIPARPLLYWALDRVGHGELLILLGVMLGLGLGYEVFEMCRVKGDLGALLVGVLLAPHPKAREMSSALLGFKDLFLVAFFLSIGISGVFGLETLVLGVLLAAVVFVKVAIYFAVLNRFRFRTRSALFASLSLANYSEFGLIVATVGERNGWIGPEWLVVFAIAVAVTFVVASPLNTGSLAIYTRIRDRLARYETDARHPEEEPIDITGAEVAILGMGRMGTGAYDAIESHYPGTTIGLDRRQDVVDRGITAGRRVFRADATDPEFWEGVSDVRGPGVVLLAMDDHRSNLYAARVLRGLPEGKLLLATARYADEVEELRKAGADRVFNLYAEAGSGFAEHAYEEYSRHVASSDA